MVCKKRPISRRINPVPDVKVVRWCNAIACHLDVAMLPIPKPTVRSKKKKIDLPFQEGGIEPKP